MTVKDRFKQISARIGLAGIRLLVRIKPRVKSFFGALARPFKPIGRFLLSSVFVPVYQVFYFLRKRFGSSLRPAKNKLMFWVTNRFAVHVTVFLIAMVTIAMNIQTNEVRAETFGERSLLYALATDQETVIIEEFAPELTALEPVVVNYRDQTALSSFARGIDFIGYDSSVAILGGGALATPTISEGSESVAPRTEIEMYVVQSGDTLSTIATRFGISLNTLLWANDLSVSSVLKPGAELTILPTSGVKHTVASGDTVDSIANEYEVESGEIIAYNRLASADDIVIGEDLIVPGGQVKAPTPPPRTSTTVTSVFTQPTTSSTIPTTTSSDDPVIAGSGTMVWPTDLHVITQYFGWSHTGIDVDCHYTNDNYAADDGIVQYAGWKGGYGYTVEINHGNGIVTRYGHHASLYVSAGQQVSKGTPVGRCGTTGRSTGTHLHFEVIVGGKFKNPLEYIR